MRITSKLFLSVILIVIFAFLTTCKKKTIPKIDWGLVQNEPERVENLDNRLFYYQPSKIIDIEEASETADYLEESGFYEEDVFLGEEKHILLTENEEGQPVLKIPSKENPTGDKERVKRLKSVGEGLYREIFNKEKHGEVKSVEFAFTDKRFSDMESVTYEDLEQ